MDIDLINFLSIIAYSLGSTVLIEGINYIFIYRKSEYKNIEKSIEEVNKKIEKNNIEVTGILNKKNYEKKTNNLDKLLRSHSSDLTKMKMKFNILTGFFMIFLINYASHLFEKVVICKLPFLPWGIFKSITHRTIGGEDYYECGYFFIVVMIGIIFRGNFHSFLGINKNTGLYNMFNQQNQKLF